NSPMNMFPFTNAERFPNIGRMVTSGWSGTTDSKNAFESSSGFGILGIEVGLIERLRQWWRTDHSAAVRRGHVRARSRGGRAGVPSAYARAGSLSKGGRVPGRVGVVGCGTMGSGIAEACARAGFDVVVAVVDDAHGEVGRARIGASLERATTEGRI